MAEVERRYAHVPVADKGQLYMAVFDARLAARQLAALPVFGASGVAVTLRMSPLWLAELQRQRFKVEHGGRGIEAFGMRMIASPAVPDSELEVEVAAA